MTKGQSTDNAPAQQSMAAALATKTGSVPKFWVCAFVLVLITLLAYQPVWHAGFSWDDDVYIINNTALRTVDGLWGIWFKPGTTIQYYPLVFTTFWLEYHFWKLQPLGYHLVNVLLHALNAVLLWRVLRRLGVPGSWWAAGIFALHPVGVESVAWITERKNVLSGFFYLLAVLAYLRFRPLTDQAAAHACDRRYYPLVLVLFLCALLSKTATCSLPAVLLLLVWWKNGRVERRDILALAPLFVLGVASGFMTTWMEKNIVGALGAEWALSFVQRCLVAGRALWFYTGKLFWPQQLTFVYPRWEIDAGVWWQYLFPVAALAVLIALWRLHSRIGRGPLAAVLFFAGTLVPVLGFFDVYYFRCSYVADHFQYLACIGLIALTVNAGVAMYYRAGRQSRNLGMLASALVLVLLAASTWKQTHVYQDLETLWRDTLAKNPAAWMAHSNLSDILIEQGKAEEAIWHLGQTLRLKPDFAVAHSNLGVALAQAGKTQEAIGHYEQALRLKPDYAEAENNLAWLFAALAPADGGDPARAITLAERACELTNHRMPVYLDTLAVAYAAAGRFNDAITAVQKAIELAHSAGRPELVREMEMRLELYRDGSAYRLPLDPFRGESTGVTSPHNR